MCGVSHHSSFVHGMELWVWPFLFLFLKADFAFQLRVHFLVDVLAEFLKLKILVVLLTFQVECLEP